MLAKTYIDSDISVAHNTGVSRNVSELARGIRERRQALKLTQEELATRAGINRESVIRIEGGGNTSTAMLRKIASALNLAAYTPDGLSPDRGDNGVMDAVMRGLKRAWIEGQDDARSVLRAVAARYVEGSDAELLAPESGRVRPLDPEGRGSDTREVRRPHREKRRR